MRWTVKIDFVEGESSRDRMVRIHRLIAEEKSFKGITTEVTLSRSMSELSSALSDTKKQQYVELSDSPRGSIARRRPSDTATLAANSGVKELDKYINKALPDRNELMMFQTPREKALSLALPSSVGVARGLRIPNIESEDRILASNILGSLPSGGMTLEESARKKLASTVKQALGDLGVGGSTVKSMLRDRIASKPFFYDQGIINQFANMIRAYHDIRDYNLHYAQAMIPGLKGIKDPQRFMDALLPSPDSILNGSTVYLIYSLGEKPSIDDFKGFVREALQKLLNLESKGKGLIASEKQLQAGKLLSEFEFDRKKAVKGIQTAVDNAMSAGGDFATSYIDALEYDADFDAFLATLTRKIGEAKKSYNEALEDGTGIFDISLENLGVPIGVGEQRTFFEQLVKEQIVFQIPSEQNNFFLVPLTLPGFNVTPIGWDRRWMIATMKVVDEYWDMIYTENRSILIQDLLYLISTRTKELFGYDIDVVQMTILALLLSPQRQARRRARSIMPRNAAGEVPLKSLATLLKDSTKEVDNTRENTLEETIRRLTNEANAGKIADADDKKDYEKIVEYLEDKGLDELRDLKDKIARTFAGDPTLLALVSECAQEIDSIINKATSYTDIDEAVKAVEDVVADLKPLVGKFTAGKKYEDFQSLHGEIGKIQDTIERGLVRSKAYLKTLTHPQLKDLIDAYGLNIQVKDSGTDRATNEIADDIHKDRGKVASRRARRMNPKGKELGIVTAEVVIGTNVLRDIGSGIRDFMGGRSKRLEKHIENAMSVLLKELHERAESVGGNYVDDIAIQPVVFGGAYMITLMAHGIAIDTTGKPMSNPPKPWFRGELNFATAEKALAYAKKLAKKTGKSQVVGRLGVTMMHAGGPKPWFGVEEHYTNFYSRDTNFQWEDIIHTVSPDGDIVKNPPSKETVNFATAEKALAYAKKLAKKTGKSQVVGRLGVTMMHAGGPKPWFGVEEHYTNFYSRDTNFQWEDIIHTVSPDGDIVKNNPHHGQGPFATQTLARSVAKVMAKRGEDVYMWYCGRSGGWMVSQDHPTDVPANEVRKFTASSKPKNNAFGPFKGFGPKAETQGKIYAGRFNTLDEITQAMDRMARLFNFSPRFNAAYREGSYGNGQEARGQITEIFYELQDMAMDYDGAPELARDIELSLAALPNPPDVFGVNREGVHIYFGIQGIYSMTDEQLENYPPEDLPPSEVHLGHFPSGVQISVVLPPEGPPKALTGRFPKSNVLLAATGDHGQLPLTGRLPLESPEMQSAQQRLFNKSLGYHANPLGKPTNPPQKKTYKGIEISGNKGAWEVVAFNKKFKTLAEARKFITNKVDGTAAPNKQCVRIITGYRCEGLVLKNKSGYKCNNCQAKYRAV